MSNCYKSGVTLCDCESAQSAQCALSGFSGADAETSLSSMVDALGVVLGSSLTVMLGATALYILIRWYQSGRCCYETSFVFNLYNIRQLKSMDLELAPPFTVSGTMHAHGPMSGYHYSQFQDSEV